MTIESETSHVRVSEELILRRTSFEDSSVLHKVILETKTTDPELEDQERNQRPKLCDLFLLRTGTFVDPSVGVPVLLYRNPKYSNGTEELDL